MIEGRNKMRKLLSLLAVLFSLTVLTGAAAANAPVIVDEHLGPFSGGIYESCVQGFDVIQNDLVIDRRLIDFFDSSGILQKEIRHIEFTATLVNSSTGYSLPYLGRLTRVFDAEAGTVTLTGLLRQTQVPGLGAVDLATGREVVVDATDEVLFAAGQTRPNYDARLCELLDH